MQIVTYCKLQDPSMLTKMLAFLGIWKEWFVEPTFHPDFYNLIPEKVDQAWKEVHGKTINETVKEYLLTYLGKPLHQLIR